MTQVTQSQLELLQQLQKNGGVLEIAREAQPAAYEQLEKEGYISSQPLQLDDFHGTRYQLTRQGELVLRGLKE
jgi:DNA-binding MarR family transcriptional regulator